MSICPGWGLRNLSQRWMRLLITALTAVIGGFLFQWLDTPIPWLLGPMVTVFAYARLFGSVGPYWPNSLRDSGIVIVGYMLGLSFTWETFREIGEQLPTMALLTVLLLVGTFVIAALVAKLSGLPLPTVLIGSVPGGLSQMVALADELPGVELTVVTFLQVSRLMMIIFCVPLLIFSPVIGASATHSAADFIAGASAAASWSGLFPHILVYAAACIGCALLWKKIRFPTAFLLGPMIATIGLHLSGYAGPALPQELVNLSQLLIGGYLGLMLKPEKLENKLKLTLLAILSGVLLILCAVGLSVLLTRLHAVPLSTSLLGLAPGGMDQMGIIAQEVGADLTFVVCYQLFRMLFIFLAVPPVLKLIFRSRRKQKPVAL